MLSGFLLGEKIEGAILLHLLELLETVDALTDGLEVGQHTAGPTDVHVVHTALLGVLLDAVGSLLLGTDEENGAALLGDLLDEGIGLLKLLHSLLQVDDVDPISHGEDILRHLGVPLLGGVTEMHACFKKLLNGNFEHVACSSFWFFPP